jgi:hypothetical protein
MTATSTRKDADAPRPAWTPPAPVGRATRIVVGALIALFAMPFVHYYVLRQPVSTVASIPFSDDFSNPKTVETNYESIGGLWRVVNGELFSPGVKNNPLWLRASLPADVAVDFDVRSLSEAGDIKCEIFGDGTDHASGYILIHGGWNNRLSVIARLDEHGRSLTSMYQDARSRGGSDLVETGVWREGTRMRIEANPFPVTIGKNEHWRIERKGGRLAWFIDGAAFMELSDPFPLKGKGHDRFGFSSWDSNLVFDNLRVTPL